MLKLLTSKSCFDLPEITSDKLFFRPGMPDIGGLFSPQIFGTSSKEIYNNMAVITLNDKFLHPILFTQVNKIYRKEIQEIMKLTPYIIKDGEIEFQLSETEDSLYGIRPFIDNLISLAKKESKTSNDFYEIVSKYGDDIFISCILVIPLGYRNYKNDVEFDLLNNFYIEVIKTSKKLLEIEKDPHSIKYASIYNHMVSSLDRLFEAIKLKLSKKEGMIRGNVLGKRVDFSARGVIVSDTSLKPDTIGLPVMIGVKIFEPWLIRILTKDYNYNIVDALKLIQKISKGYNEGKEYEIVKEALIKVTRNRVVLAKRDPTLHRLSWQAFKIVIVDDKSIHIYPLQTTSFNADFDGDSVISDVNLKIKAKNFEKTIKVNILDLENLEIEEILHGK